jgi:hypothetical protein
MKANEAKSKFVYPDKLYARTNNNITLDISYAPQTLEAVEYVRTDAFIEKAVEWLMENVEKHISADGEYTVYYKEMFEDFVNYMKGE